MCLQATNQCDDSQDEQEEIDMSSFEQAIYQVQINTPSNTVTKTCVQIRVLRESYVDSNYLYIICIPSVILPAGGFIETLILCSPSVNFHIADMLYLKGIQIIRVLP